MQGVRLGSGNVEGCGAAVFSPQRHNMAFNLQRPVLKAAGLLRPAAFSLRDELTEKAEDI